MKILEKNWLLIIFGKFSTKARAFENITIFLQQFLNTFFRFRGDPPFPPGYAFDLGNAPNTKRAKFLSFIDSRANIMRKL